MVLVGPSGSGKTTALRMLAGLEPVDDGAIRVGGRVINKVAPKDRDVAMVFQNYALYPHMSVAENIGFHLRVKRVPRTEIDQRVREVAGLLDLEPYLDRKPAQLSGGQRQRVAMGRAIVRQPQAFLMDEPLSNLDAKLRVATRAEIASLQRRLGVTTVYVTHDQVEAMTMGDRVAVLRDGVLQQYDTPRTLYRRPANQFVAGFIGSPAMNFLSGVVDGEVVRCGPLSVPALPGQRGRSAAVTVGLRPESLEVSSSGEGLPVTVELIEELGADTYAHGTVSLDGGASTRLVVRLDPRVTPPDRGSRIWVAARAEEAHFFDAETGERLAD
jgi:multiple sugar transport system ATP-binding protein